MKNIVYSPLTPDHIENLAQTEEIFVDGYQGALASGDLVKLNFFSSFFDPKEQQIRRVAALRLVMGKSDFMDVVRALNQLAVDIQQRTETDLKGQVK